MSGPISCWATPLGGPATSPPPSARTAPPCVANRVTLAFAPNWPGSASRRPATAPPHSRTSSKTPTSSQPPTPTSPRFSPNFPTALARPGHRPSTARLDPAAPCRQISHLRQISRLRRSGRCRLIGRPRAGRRGRIRRPPQAGCPRPTGPRHLTAGNRTVLLSTVPPSGSPFPIGPTRTGRSPIGPSSRTGLRPLGRTVAGLPSTGSTPVSSPLADLAPTDLPLTDRLPSAVAPAGRARASQPPFAVLAATRPPTTPPATTTSHIESLLFVEIELFVELLMTVGRQQSGDRQLLGGRPAPVGPLPKTGRQRPRSWLGVASGRCP